LAEDFEDAEMQIFSISTPIEAAYCQLRRFATTCDRTWQAEQLAADCDTLPTMLAASMVPKPRRIRVVEHKGNV
jgi:hypothetical protein